MRADSHQDHDLFPYGAKRVLRVPGLLGHSGIRVHEAIIHAGQEIKDLLAATNNPDWLAAPLYSELLAGFQVADIDFHRRTSRLGFLTGYHTPRERHQQGGCSSQADARCSNGEQAPTFVIYILVSHVLPQDSNFEIGNCFFAMTTGSAV
jgi:hypothetical protein